MDRHIHCMVAVFGYARYDLSVIDYGWVSHQKYIQCVSENVSSFTTCVSPLSLMISRKMRVTSGWLQLEFLCPFVPGKVKIPSDPHVTCCTVTNLFQGFLYFF